jgi:phage repressor protein C with HTH and peptisase S24 domain
VRGDSMETEFHEGDIIVINPYLKPEHNDYVVVSNEEGEATFKQLKKYGRTRVLLLPMNCTGKNFLKH